MSKLFCLFFLSIPLFGDSYIPKYCWSLGYSIAADVTPFKDGLPPEYKTDPPSIYVDPEMYIDDVHEGDIVWVQASQITKFCKETLPFIQNPFILVISDGDESFPSIISPDFDIQNLFNNDRVLAIFSQNIDMYTPHPKLKHIPIGLDFHSMTLSNGFFGEPTHSVQEQEKILDSILTSLLPTHLRKKRAFVDFHIGDKVCFGETRRQILRKIESSGVIDSLARKVPRHTLWKMKGAYAFSVSPHGNGLDCHRTWEDLLLGCIVIVKTSPLDPLYEGLPVVIINDWSEITPENFDLWFDLYSDAFTNPTYREKLTHAYWMHKIRSQKTTPK